MKKGCCDRGGCGIYDNDRGEDCLDILIWTQSAVFTATNGYYIVMLLLYYLWLLICMVRL